MKLLLCSLFFLVKTVSCEKDNFKEIFPDIPEEVVGLIPPEIRAFLEALPEPDREAIRAAARMNDAKKAIIYLKEKSPLLGAKIDSMYKEFQKRVENLKDGEAKKFTKEVIYNAKSTQQTYAKTGEISVEDVKKQAHEAVVKFENLSIAARTELNRTFPKFLAFFENEDFLKRIDILKDSKEQS